jgi:hypothetical protein
MKKIIFALLAVIVLAGCQTLSVTVNPGGGPCEITIRDSNNKEVITPTDLLRNANLQAPMQGGTTQGDQVQGK